MFLQMYFFSYFSSPIKIETFLYFIPHCKTFVRYKNKCIHQDKCLHKKNKEPETTDSLFNISILQHAAKEALQPFVLRAAQHLVRRAFLGDNALIHEHNLVSHRAGKSHLMGNHQHRQAFLRQIPTYSIFPGIAIMMLVLAFNNFGDGLRDALDPKLKNL